MGKLILLLSLFGTAILFSFGLTDPSNPIVWLASTSTAFAYLRLGIMLALASLLVTHPPRNHYLRLAIGIFAVGLGAWTLWATYDNQMKLLDSLTLLQFSISAGLVVLESDYIPVESKTEEEEVQERIKAAREARRLAAAS